MFFFWNSVLKTKPATKTKSAQERKSFTQFHFYAIAQRFVFKKIFWKRTGTLKLENGASYGWSLSQVSEHVFIQKYIFATCKSLSNWVLIEAIQGFQWHFSRLTFHISLDLVLKICLTSNFLSFLSAFKRSRIEKLKKN